VTAFLSQHAPVDHAAYIHYLRPDIPIYCSEGTRLIMQAFQVQADFLHAGHIAMQLDISLLNLLPSFLTKIKIWLLNLHIAHFSSCLGQIILLV
jgi:hypothetical protein